MYAGFVARALFLCFVCHCRLLLPATLNFGRTYFILICIELVSMLYFAFEYNVESTVSFLIVSLRCLKRVAV